MTRLRAFFADIPYDLSDRSERHYQTLFYLVFRLMGQYARAEQRSAAGRCDAVVVVTGDTMYMFEFKLAREGSGDEVVEALKQIDEKGYLVPWMADGCALVKTGAAFDPATRTLGDWKAVRV